MSQAQLYNYQKQILDNVFHIQVPAKDSNGNFLYDNAGNLIYKYVKKIYKNSVKSQNIIWQQKKLTYTFHDNIPVNVYYNINSTPVITVRAENQTTTEAKIMWLVPIGNIQMTNAKVLNSFSTANYARTPIYIDWTTTTSFELTLKIKTGSNVNTRQELFSMTNTESIELEILGNKLHWEKYGVYGRTTLTANTNYFIRVVKNLTSFKVYISDDGVNYDLDIDSSANFNVTNEYMHFGIDKVCGGTTVEPFLGTIDLSQSKFLYGNVLYQIDMNDDAWWDLIKTRNIVVDNNQVISNFEGSNKGESYCSYVYSKNYIDWTDANEFEICIHLKTGDSVYATGGGGIEFCTWRNYNASDNFDNVNDFSIVGGYFTWEGASAQIVNYIQLKNFKAQPNTEYYLFFCRNGTTGYFQICDVNYKSLDKATINKFPVNYKQYMYLGLDEHGMATTSKYWSTAPDTFHGKIYCDGSYVKLDGKKYKFRI